MRPLSLLALTLASLTIAACLPPSAADTCEVSAREYAGAVVGAFNTTVGAIRNLEPRPAEPARWPDLAPDRQAILCYVDAQIAKGPPPGPNGEIREPFDRVVIGVVDGKAELVMAGYRDDLPALAP